MLNTFVFISLFSCTNEKDEICEERWKAFSGLTLALSNGTPEPSYLGIGHMQQLAIVRLRPSTDSDSMMCTGTVVAPGLVLTAKHCSVSAEMSVDFGKDANSPLLSVPIKESHEHPDLDLLLVSFEQTPETEKLPIRPIRPWQEPLQSTDMGRLAQIAGFGWTEVGDSGHREFLVESITDIDHEMIVVDGLGRSGACAGDSGGPLMLRDEVGEVRVLGVLHDGSNSCLGIDRYTRVDIVRQWMAGFIGDRNECYIDDCGELTRLGRCYENNAVWCTGDELNSYLCSENTHCGWSPVEQGYRCVTDDADSCKGISNWGKCEGRVAVYCEDGVLSSTECSDIEGDCLRSASTGMVGCHQLME